MCVSDHLLHIDLTILMISSLCERQQAQYSQD